MTEKEFGTRYAAARRKVIAADFKNLNDMQREAVMATQGPLLLLAGAGSGKTTVLIHRIANVMRYGRASDSPDLPEGVTEDELLFLEAYAAAPEQAQRTRAERLAALDPAPPWRIIAITFTNKAAGELKSRLERMMGPAADDIWAMTFHSACVRILRRDIDRLGYDRAFTIYDTADSQSLVKRIIKELDLDDKTFPYRTVLGYISRAKDAMISAEEFCASAEKAGDIRRKHIGRVYTEYARRMKAASALDFDDLILLAVRLLTEYEDVRESYQRRFQYVLVDEYQDTNNLQYILASTLAGGWGNICVVGDDDQSIYKFRGATIENILGFEEHYKNARVIRLEQNYRSTAHIIDAANQVIAHNQGRKGKTLWTKLGAGSKPELHIAEDERGESAFVADRIIANVSEGKKWSDHAVLYRMNAQSNQIENAFKRGGIPYRIVGGTRFFDRAEIKDMLAYLCLVANPADDLRLQRVINNPPRGIGGVTVEAVMQAAQEDGRPAFDILLDSQNYPALQKAAGRLHQFADMILGLREAAETLPLDEFYDLVIHNTGYVRMLEEKRTDENLTRIENVSELKTNIVNFLRETDGGSLADFLTEVSLYTDIDNYDRDADSVVMMTIHSAKGLEFDTVFIVGAEEGIFPGIRSIGEQEEMEEERRLCYVAMTRARRQLYFTCAGRRTLFGKTAAGMTSRFVGEVGEENIIRPQPVQRTFRFEEYFDDTSDHARRDNARRDGAYTPYSSRRTSYPPRAAAVRPPIPAPKPAAPVSFAVGDEVEHRAFGRGRIVAVKPAGGDALLEAEFETVGTKRLMLKAATQYMKKAE